MVLGISERNSSGKKNSKETSKMTRRELEDERKKAEKKVEMLRYTLKPQASFSSAYWIQNAKIALASKRSVQCQPVDLKSWLLQQATYRKL